MWWIIGSGIFVTGMLFVRSKMQTTKRLDRKDILDRIATEFLDLKAKGESMDEIRGALYREFGIQESQDYDLIYGAQMPREVVDLGEIVYTVFCHRELFRKPRNHPKLRERLDSWDAFVSACSSVVSKMTVIEAMGTKIDPALWGMVKKWRQHINFISKVHGYPAEPRV